jgi:hypothetical protein
MLKCGQLHVATLVQCYEIWFGVVPPQLARVCNPVSARLQRVLLLKPLPPVSPPVSARLQRVLLLKPQLARVCNACCC